MAHKGVTLQQFKDAYDPKYAWEIEIDKGGIYVVTPKKVFAFIEHSEKFQTTATRWYGSSFGLSRFSDS